MQKPSAKFEQQKLRSGYKYVIGCDEVGRGCLAGPVVAAAIVLNPLSYRKLRGVRDSKLLTYDQRAYLEPIIKSSSLAWGIGVVKNVIIDEVNIHRASLLAMRQAILDLEKSFKLSVGETAVVVDGKFLIPDLDFYQEAIVDGDAKIISVSAASIVAKVYRDRLMIRQHKKFPQYNFAQHKGYATLDHRSRLKQYGPSKIHRLSFI